MPSPKAASNTPATSTEDNSSSFVTDNRKSRIKERIQEEEGEEAEESSGSSSSSSSDDDGDGDGEATPSVPRKNHLSTNATTATTAIKTTTSSYVAATAAATNEGGTASAVKQKSDKDENENHTKKVSCQPCREAKVKCIPSSSSSTSNNLGGEEPAPCSRCIKLERECFYRVHKRGRKPGKIKLQQILRRLELLDRTLNEIKELNKEVGDEDAHSLIETLRWQLHRSKFFTKGAGGDCGGGGGGGGGLVEDFKDKDRGKGNERDYTVFKREENSQSYPGAGSSSGGRGTPIPIPPPTSMNHVAHRASSASASATTSTVPGPTGGTAEMGKSRSDFNMLVDMEDHASVARVPDEFPTLSNPLKLLAQASSEESARRTKRNHIGSDGFLASTRRRASSGLRRQASFDPHHPGEGGSSEDDYHHERRGGLDRNNRATSQPRLFNNNSSSSSSDHDGHGGRSRKRLRSRSPSPSRGIHNQQGQQQRNRQEDDPTNISTDSAKHLNATTNATTAVTTATNGDRRGASSWASTYFSRGAFHPVYDNRQEFDPIDQGLLTVSQASRLIESFYSTFGTFMHIFDPTLSTITYIRKHSAFLLTVICALSAEFEASSDAGIRQESAQLALVLRRHYEGMITWITSGDYKNVEMAQAFFLLASYRPMSDSAMSDQTWLFLGTAIRIATELGCNLVCYSYGSNTGGKEGGGAGGEHYQRQLRNTERLWINLWNLEKTLASQTGQRMHLADEGVIATCSRWHRMPVALRQDEALVAQVELRRIMIAQGDHFNTHVLRSLGARRRVSGGGPAGGGEDSRAKNNETARTRKERSSRVLRNGNDKEAGVGEEDDEEEVNDEEEEEEQEEDALSMAERDQLSLQLSYFRNSVTMDLKRWEERWLSSSSSSSSSNQSDGPTPLQITGPLTLDYAALVTYALPLPITYTVDVTPELASLYRHCYICCTNYMATFVDRSQRGYMDHVTNSTIVCTVYAVVFALDLARKHQVQQSNTTSHDKGKKKAEKKDSHNIKRKKGKVETFKGVDFGFVSRKRVLNLAKLTARELDKIGGARKGRIGRSIASKYSVFLQGVLGRFDGGGGGGEGSANEAEDDRDDSKEEDDVDEDGDDEAAVQRGFAPRTAFGGSGTDTSRLRRSYPQSAAAAAGVDVASTQTATSSSAATAAATAGRSRFGNATEQESMGSGGEGRHLRRDHNHPLVTPNATAYKPPTGAAAASGGTRASHSYSSNIHFSPVQQYVGVAPSTPAAGAVHLGSGWVAPAPSPSHPISTGTSSVSQQQQQGGWNARFVPPPHHHQQQQQHPHPQQSIAAGGGGNVATQTWVDQQNSSSAAAATEATMGALSPATWFNHLQHHHHAGPTGASATGTAATPGGMGGGIGMGMEEDPSWEWMMKDLDFFNVDGGGGGGEPILDQMGRLFG